MCLPTIQIVLGSFLLLAAPMKPIDFPQAPIAKEVWAGVRIYSQRKGLDRLYLDDRRVVGLWFDGKRKVEADHVLWLSPSLMSRWLGYLEAAEKWPHGELEARWSSLRASLGGRLTFVIRLCSMPRVDFLEGEATCSPDFAESSHVRFLLTASEVELPERAARHELLGVNVGTGRAPKPLQAAKEALRIDPWTAELSSRRARDASSVLKEDWWQRVPFARELTPEFASPTSEVGYPLGDYRCNTYLASSPLPKEPFPASGFQFRVFSPKKERIAKFSVFDRSAN